MKAGLAASAVLLIIFGTCYGGASRVPDGIELTYYDPAAFSVSLAGNFNNWDIKANPMVKDEGGTWRVVVELPPGDYEYKFVVNGGTWMADPENPRVVGDYGNSGITINEDGEPELQKAAGGIALISNTPVNSRVLINGWYRGTFITRKDVLGDVRWRFTRPRHEMYVGIDPTVGQNVRGSGTIRIDSGVGDIREIRADFYQGWLDFKSGMFGVTGYYNEELIAYDNPLQSVGHIDLLGTMWEDGIDFGRGTQGLILDLWLGPTDSRIFYSNTYEKDIYNNLVRWTYNPETEDYDAVVRYDNTGTDLLGLRTKFGVAAADFGVTFISERNGWWVGFEEENEEDVYLDQYRSRTRDDESTWFEAATSRWDLGADVKYTHGDWLSVFGEVATNSYWNGWDAANRVRKQGDQLVDGAIDVTSGEEGGYRFKAGLEADRGRYGFSASYERAAFSGMDAENLYVTSEQIPFEDIDTGIWPYYGPPLLEESTYVRTYVNINSVDEFYIYQHDPLPERSGDRARIDLWGTGLGQDFGIQFEILDSEWKSPITETTSYNTWLKIIPYVRGRLFGERLGYDLAYRSTGNNLHGRMPSEFDLGEMIVKGDVGLGKNWYVYYNFRWAYYNWMDGGEAQSEGFLNPHLAFVWDPIPNVEIRLGWGVNPLYYIDTPVEGREIGRERWRTSYMWVNPHQSLIMAEREMDSIKMLSLMGVISF